MTQARFWFLFVRGGLVVALVRILGPEWSTSKVMVVAFLVSVILTLTSALEHDDDL